MEIGRVRRVRTVGIICEYHPFHNGHLYHLTQAKKELQCEAAVCVMSGAFVQRGEVALFDKWERARAALAYGADLVLELPAYVVLQSAGQFADGGIQLLDALGVVDAVSFGSECGDLQLLQDIASVLAEEPMPFQTALKNALGKGMGYPAALCQAFETCWPQKDIRALLCPNNLLAANYLAALQRLGSRMLPHTLKRQATGHHDMELKGTIASGTAIRRALLQGRTCRDVLPGKSVYSCQYRMERLEPLLLGYLRIVDAAQLGQLPGMEQGLANRMLRAARQAVSWPEYIAEAVTKRYTASRIRRLTAAALLGFRLGAKLDYVRILGLTPRGAQLLRTAKQVCPFPIITKTADAYLPQDSMFWYDIRATDLAALACSDTRRRIAGADYRTSPVFVKNTESI